MCHLKVDLLPLHPGYDLDNVASLSNWETSPVYDVGATPGTLPCLGSFFSPFVQPSAKQVLLRA